MWVNDEGRILDLPVHRAATVIARHHGVTHQVFHGPAVFTGGADGDGRTLPLDDTTVEAIHALL